MMAGEFDGGIGRIEQAGDRAIIKGKTQSSFAPCRLVREIRMTRHKGTRVC